MSLILINQGDISRLKYLVAWTYAGPDAIRMRTEFAESEEEAWQIVLNESIRHSVTEREKSRRWGNPRIEFIRAPDFKVEVLSLSLARGFNDQIFMERVGEATELLLKQRQTQEDNRFNESCKRIQEQEYATYLALKAKYEPKV